MYKIMTYNLFEGAQNSYKRLVQFFKSTEVDVVCFQEANGWHVDNFRRLKDFAAQCGFTNYAFCDSNTRFKLATLSRVPIVSQQVFKTGFWHGVLKTVIMLGSSKVELFNLHLDPKFEDLRVKEVKRLIPLLTLQASTIAVGDFNSLSQHDNYAATTIKKLKSHGITKFGYETLQFDVTNMLEARGLIDVSAKLSKMSTSVPTPSCADKKHTVPLRLDYAFASPSAMQRITDARVIKNSLTNAISDHYPLYLTLRG